MIVTYQSFVCLIMKKSRNVGVTGNIPPKWYFSEKFASFVAREARGFYKFITSSKRRTHVGVQNYNLFCSFDW